MAFKHEELTGAVEHIRYTSQDGTFIIASLDTGDCILGNVMPGAITPGVTYRFLGSWSENPEYGRQFRFSAFIQHVPHSRHGVAEYLKRNCQGIGDVIAHQLCDLYDAEHAVSMLKRNPEKCVEQVKRLNLPVAKQASLDLISIEKFEQTKIELLDLFAGRGFFGELIDQCIKSFGILAPSRIKHDPFTLLVNKMPSCGFLRVDRLYLDLGLPPDRLKRQVMCALHSMRSGMSGSTWHAAIWIEDEIGRQVSGNVRAGRAIELALRAGIFAEHEDDGGVRWIADAGHAADEALIGDRVAVLV